MHRQTTFTVLFTIATVLAVSTTAFAQAGRTIQVTGTGNASASPNYLVMSCNLSEGGDTAKEATANFAKAKEKAAKLLAGGPEAGYEVEFAGEKLASSAAGDDAVALAAAGGFGGVAPAASGKYSISEQVTLKLAIENDMQREGIVNKVADVVDAVKKAGLSFDSPAGGIYAAAMGLGGSSGVLQFNLDAAGQTKLRDKAYADAFSDARSRAESLAQLSGGRLGKVISVQEVLAATESSDLEAMQMNMLSQMFGGAAAAAAGGIDHNGQIEVQQSLVVTFELVD